MPCLRLPLPGLNAILAHGQRPIDAVQFVIKTASVAHGLAVVVASPEGGVPSATVAAAEAEPPRSRLQWTTGRHRRIG